MEDNVSKETIIQNIETYYDQMANYASKELEGRISRVLDAGGIMYRIFSRKKSKASIIAKMNKKAETKYIPNQTRMQDLVGIRVVLYFKDDVDICIKALCNIFLEENREHDHPDSETFRPQRINYVFKVPDDIDYISNNIRNTCYIDNTFEVQIRTIFSEGWHEVEHDIRYKYQNVWKGEEALSRELNGIMAVLEICDNDIISVCNSLAYKKYKKRSWESMIRNCFRIRLAPDKLSDFINERLNDDADLGKKIFRFDRNDLIGLFMRTKLPKTCDNVVYLINEHSLHDNILSDKTPKIVTRKYKNAYKQ